MGKVLGFARSNAIGLLALFVALGGTSYAATGGFSSGGTLKACANEEGRLKLLKSGEHCKRGQKTVAWNQTGPAGPKGAPGVAGAAGAAGANGGQGGQGPQGTALAYAHVTTGATLDTANSSGVVDVQRSVFTNTGYYCLYGNFTPHAATASLDSNETTTGNEHVLGVAFSTSVCPASATGAPFRVAVVIIDEKITQPANAGFFITIN